MRTVYQTAQVVAAKQVPQNGVASPIGVAGVARASWSMMDGVFATVVVVVVVVVAAWLDRRKQTYRIIAQWLVLAPYAELRQRQNVGHVLFSLGQVSACRA